MVKFLFNEDLFAIIIDREWSLTVSIHFVLIGRALYKIMSIETTNQKS